MISVNSIIGSEIKIVHQYIDMLRRLPNQLINEIIIVSSGTDGTNEILHKYAIEDRRVKVINYLWIRDFAHARNKCLEFTTNPHAIMLDTDDEIPEETIRQMLTPGFQSILDDKSFIMFSIENIGPNGIVNESFMQCRIFPVASWVKWSDKIHENLNSSITKYAGVQHQCPSLVITHKGYADKNVNQDKALRNLEYLMTVEVKDAIHYSHVAACLSQLLRYDEAVANYKYIIQNFPVSYEFQQYILYNIGLVYEKKGDHLIAMEYYLGSQTQSSLVRIGNFFDNIYDRVIAYKFSGLLDENDLQSIKNHGQEIKKELFSAFLKANKLPNKYSDDSKMLKSYVEGQLK